MEVVSGKRAEQTDDRGLLAVRVTPRARRDEIAGLREGVLQVRVAALPEDGRANEAVCRLVARRLGVPLRSVTLVKGQRSRQKLISVAGIGAAEALRRLLD